MSGLATIRPEPGLPGSAFTERPLPPVTGIALRAVLNLAERNNAASYVDRHNHANRKGTPLMIEYLARGPVALLFFWALLNSPGRDWDMHRGGVGILWSNRPT